MVGDRFLDHQAGINEIYVALKFRPTPDARVRFLRWHTFRQSISDAIKLTPDGYCELATAAGIRASFLEIDLGTEALSVWEQKTGYYLQLAVSGEFPKRFRQAQFRVLVVANAAKRLGNIRRLVAKTTDKIFWFATLESINREGIWSPVWLRPTGDQSHSLL